MTIYHAFDAQGAFIAGDTDTGHTCYAYPSSPHADMAARKGAAAAVAARMVQDANTSAQGFPHAVTGPYDRRNWDKLAALVL